MGDKDHINMLVDGIAFIMPPAPPLSQNLNSSDTCNRDHLPKNCGTPCSCPHTHDIKRGAVVEVVIYNERMANPLLDHPFHLHGYSFHIFKIGHFSNKTSDSINTIDKAIQEHVRTLPSGKYNLQPPGKDTIVISGRTYVIFRFKADNPGWWLLHCHYLYHTVNGMGVILHVGEQSDLPSVPPMFPTCHSYAPDIDV